MPFKEPFVVYQILLFTWDPAGKPASSRIGLLMALEYMESSWHEYDEVHFDAILGI